MGKAGHNEPKLFKGGIVRVGGTLVMIKKKDQPCCFCEKPVEGTKGREKEMRLISHAGCLADAPNSGPGSLRDKLKKLGLRAR